MEKKIPLGCNLRFNSGNERHLKAAQILSMVGMRYKTAFVTLAIEAYLDANPMGIDMNALLDVQKNTVRSGVPKVSIQENIRRKKDLPQSNEAIKDGMNFYDIE